MKIQIYVCFVMQSKPKTQLTKLHVSFEMGLLSSMENDVKLLCSSSFLLFVNLGKLMCVCYLFVNHGLYLRHSVALPMGMAVPDLKTMLRKLKRLAFMYIFIKRTISMYLLFVHE